MSSSGHKSSSGLIRDLQLYADDIVTRYGLPAVSIAIWHDNQLYQAASGVLNIATGVTATVDSVFQIGSISKVFTTSLIMLLVDQGRVELDRPVRDYLPEFHVADPEATQIITLRHLLSNTSGLVSDASLIHEDALEEGRAIALYVDRCFLLPQAHRQIGLRFSYSNAGFVIAGRVAEVVLGLSWRKAIESLILQPLGMTQSLVCPTELLRFRAAMGHVLSGSVAQRTTAVHSRCYLSAGLGPTGSLLTMSAADLLKFGMVHLNEGTTPSGARWLSQSSARIMQEAQVDLPAPSMMMEDSWGVGWGLKNSLAVRVFGHGGGTAGQNALLEVIPERQSAFVVQMNGMKIGGAPALEQVQSDLLYELAGIKAHRPAPSGARPEDLSRFVGTFGLVGHRYEITQKDGQLHSQMHGSNTAAELLTLQALGEDRFAAYTADGDRMDDLAFLDPDDRGRPTCLFTGWRMQRRI